MIALPRRAPAARALAAVVGAALLAAPAVGGAQSVTPQLAAGMAAPAGPLGAHRAAGPALRASLLVGSPERWLRLRADAEAAWMAGSGGRADGPSSTGDLVVAAATGSLVAGPRRASAAPYVLLGGGAAWMDVRGHRGRNGVSPVIQAGIGYRVPVAGARVHVELTPRVVISDYATGETLSPAVYWPLVVGVSF